MRNNTVSNLNEYLFAALDAITNDDLKEEELDKEIKRADAVIRVSGTIIENSRLLLAAAKAQAEYSGKVAALEQLPLLGVESDA